MNGTHLEGASLLDAHGLTVEQATELRRELRKAGIEYRVVKNTLARKALERVAGHDRVFDRLVGPTGIAFAFDDPVVPAKIIHRFAEKHNKLSLKVCLVEKEVYDGAKLKELAVMPSRSELLAAIVGSVQSPLAGVPMVINALLRDVVSLVDEIGKKKAA